SSAGRRIFAPSSPSVGTSSRTTRRTTSASSLSGLRILFPLSRAFPRGPVWTARSRSAYPRSRRRAFACSIASIARVLTEEIRLGRDDEVGGSAVAAHVEAADDRHRNAFELAED